MTSVGGFGTLSRVQDFDKDEDQDGGVLFYLNKGGFPINAFTWERMWQYAAKIHSRGQEGVKEIREAELQEVPVPAPPFTIPGHLTVPEKVERVQKYMKDLQYNHTGTQFFEIKKSRPISGLMDCAKEMIKESLPIKCLEAVILGVFLTNGMTNLERFPISFKTSSQGHVYRHVVLGLYCCGSWGAIGMSRRDSLAYKPLVFKTLTDLVMDFKVSYNKYLHEVKKTKLGMPISHDPLSYETIAWKTTSIDGGLSRADVGKEVDKHVKDFRLRLKFAVRRNPNVPSPAKDMAAYLARDMRQDKSKAETPSTVVRVSREVVRSNDTRSRSKSTLGSSTYNVRV